MKFIMSQKWILVIAVITIACFKEAENVVQQPGIGRLDRFLGAFSRLISPVSNITENGLESDNSQTLLSNGIERIPIYVVMKEDDENLPLEEMRRIIHNKHSVYRRLHNVKPLVMSSEINKFSQDHAEYLAELGTLRPSNGTYGENIGFSNAKNLTLKSAIIGVVEGWYNEISNYDFNRPEHINKALHFTQLVWKGSSDIGIGVAIRKDEKSTKVYVVCNYDPIGNLRGDFEYNVFNRKNQNGAPKFIAGSVIWFIITCLPIVIIHAVPNVFE